ncbi:hypothetical protein [Leptospira fluminis]|nr:hypothetical protein [Leptospira fluminis]
MGGNNYRLIVKMEIGLVGYISAL